MARKLSSSLFRASRVTRDIEVLASGDPKKMARRAKNKWLGRNVIRKMCKGIYSAYAVSRKDCFERISLSIDVYK